METDIFESIQNGNISYELVRPISVYNMWFIRSIATRISKTVLRCLPILLMAFLLPKSFRLSAPQTFSTFFLFVITMILALLVVISMNMIIYFLSFYTINALGIRMIFQSVGDLLSGGIIPLPFFPAGIQKIVLFLPFASVQNIPFRIYSGDLVGKEMIQGIGLQLFWLISLVSVGKFLESKVVKNVVIQGG